MLRALALLGQGPNLSVGPLFMPNTHAHRDLLPSLLTIITIEYILFS